MIVCYDNTVNGQKLADVDCGLDSACIPTAGPDWWGGGHHTFAKRKTENIPAWCKVLQRKQVLKQ